MPRLLNLLVLVSLFGAILACALPARDLYAADVGQLSNPPNPEQSAEFFEKQVRPILVARCYECHGPEISNAKGGLRIDSRAALLKGGDTGAAIVPGNAKKSLLVDAINYGDTYQMPPKRRLSVEEVAVLTRWVEQGAFWPEQIGGKFDLAAKAFDLEKRKSEHWVWRPITAPALPEVRQTDWPHQSLDRFILAKLEERKLRPAPQAERRALLRRVYFDLVGLPPSNAEVAAFTADNDPAALEKLVDRLLASPQFGERWGRHWLDLVRYGESRGHEFDYNAPNAWQYRDYVIRAFNADVAYDHFVTEHVAGDLLAEPRRNPTVGFNESILGTGFWFLGEWVHSPVDIRGDETDRYDNMLDVFGKTFCGLTVACARCHDHKFDAISQRDYYALAGYLQGSSFRQAAFDTLENHRQVATKLAELKGKFRPQALKLAGQAWQGRSDSLLHAVEVLAQFDLNQLTDDARQRMSASAERHQLPAGQITQWIAYLQTAKKDESDPLAPLARWLLSGNTDAARRKAVESLLEVWRGKQQAAQRALSVENTVLDYQRPGCDAWLSDGYSFGLAPVARGEVQLTDDPARILGRAATHAAAVRDPAFNSLEFARNVEADPSRVNWPRAGRTIKTRTFTLTAEKVHVLVRGGGHVYAVVDSHWLNHGPLHGSLLQSWKSDGGRPRWITQQLAPYVGHRLHLEFSPDGNENLEVLLAVQGDRPPLAITETPAAMVLEELDRTMNVASCGGNLTSAALAETYQRLLTETIARLGRNELDGEKDYSTLWNWLRDHEDLFPPSAANAAAQQELTDLAGKYVQSRQELASGIKRTSQLAMAMWQGTPADEFLLVRGNSKTPGDKVPARPLAALGGEQIAASAEGHSREALARWLTAADNPLTARVLVNRVWHHLLGRGIVASVDNFGVLGDRPTHPELLDYLADDFRRDGWSIKRLVRRIVLSSTYQMSSVGSPEAEKIDPTNLLLQHARVRRLEAEPIRDSLLAISGRLDGAMYGPSVPVFLTAFMEGRGRPKSGPLDGDGRRSIYIATRRNFLSPMMLAFDAPTPSTCVGRRNVSNVPAQALTMMNDPLVIEQANLWAKRVLAEPGRTPSQRIARLYGEGLAREPSADETASALAFLQMQAEQLGVPAERWQVDVRPWADLCHVIFNMKEFIFLD